MTYLRGIDVSHWQGTTPGLAGLDFLFARSTFGTAKDDKYEMHKANALRAGLEFGAYHFGDPNKSVAAQLAACLAATQGVRMVVLDIEANDMTLLQARVFIKGLQDAGKWAGVYHSLSDYPWYLGQDFDWLAAWGRASVPGPWEFWQYRGSPGDLDYYNGTRAQLSGHVGIPYAPDSSIGDEPVNISSRTPLFVDLQVGDQLYDTNGVPLVKVSVAQTQTSPFEVAVNDNFHARAFPITTGGKDVLALAHTSEVETRPIPVVTDDGYTKATQDAAVAAVSATLSATQTALAAARAAYITAAASERKRIADAEAARIEGI